MEIVINGKTLTEDEVKVVVNEWYTNGMYPDILQDHNGSELDEILNVGDLTEPYTVETTGRIGVQLLKDS